MVTPGGLAPVVRPRVPLPADDRRADRGRRAGRLRVEAGVAPDPVLALGRGHAQREVLEVLLADVLDARERVLGQVGAGGVAPGAGRDAARVGAAALGRLVVDHHAVLRRGHRARLEPHLPVHLVGAGEEEVDARVARLLERGAHAGRPVLVVGAGDVDAVVADLGAGALEVGGRDVADVVARLLEPRDGRVVGARVPVAQDVVVRRLVGPVERDLDGARGPGDGLDAGRLVVVERLAAPVVVRLVARVGDAVQDLRVAPVVAHDERDVRVAPRVAARDAQQVHARGPGRGRGQRRVDRPVRAVEQAQAGRAHTARLRADRHREQRREQARAGPAVVAAAEHLDVHRGAGAGLQLEADGAALVDARGGGEAVHARRQVGVPVRAAGEAVLLHDGVRARARPRPWRGLDDRRVGRLDAADRRPHRVVVRRAVGGRQVGEAGRDAGPWRAHRAAHQRRRDRRRGRAAEHAVAGGARLRLPADLDARCRPPSR